MFEEYLGELREVKIEFAQPPHQGKKFMNLPFWQFLPNIKIYRRAIDKKSFLDAPADTLKSRLYSPAFEFNDIKEVANLCGFLTMNNPRYKQGPMVQFETCKYNHLESHRIARSIFLLIEAQEKDKVSGMDYELILEDPKLVILPFEVSGDFLVSPFLHVQLPIKAIK